MCYEIFDHLYTVDRLIRFLHRWRMAPSYIQFAASREHHRLFAAFYRIAAKNLSAAVDRIRCAIFARFFIVILHPSNRRGYAIR